MLEALQEGEGAGAAVEAVLIPIVRAGGARPRTTLCVSSQVGCGMNCQFCFTGRLGLRAQLSAAQIVEQARRLSIQAIARNAGCGGWGFLRGDCIRQFTEGLVSLGLDAYMPAWELLNIR